MARNFVAASSQFLETDTAVVTGVPYSFACWFNSNGLTNQRAFSLLDKDSDTEYFDLEVWGDGVIYAGSITAGSSAWGATTGTYSAGVWTHAAGVWASSTSRTAYRDGGNSGNNTVNITPVGMDRTSIGRLGALTPVSFFDGLIAEAAVWDTDLTAAEVAVLATGASPLFVRPTSIIAYWPLIGRFSPETDIVGGLNLTVTGATAGDHCRVYNPAVSRRQRDTAAGQPMVKRWGGVPHMVGSNYLHGGGVW